MESKLLKQKVVGLRRSGKTYSEINSILGTQLPKSTLTYWCKEILLTKIHRERIRSLVCKNIEKARELALAANRTKKNKYFKLIVNKNKHLPGVLKNDDVAKIALAMLYACEGGKSGGSIKFGNSDPVIIGLFLTLLRQCYRVNEKKFRCTLQSRANQDIKRLNQFWSKVTNIPLNQFYKARIDPRTIGKMTKKLEYKGVCKIDYFSADIFNELNQVLKILYLGL